MLKRVFQPEFLNRVDEIIVFERLSQSDLKIIATMMLSEFSGRMREKGITVNIEDSALTVIAEKGYSAEYGARPLRKAISAMIEDRFASMILLGKAKEGDSFKIVGRKNDENEGYIEFEGCE